MADNKNKFMNEAGKGGLILASVVIAYMLIGGLLGKIQNGGFALSLLKFILWGGKLFLCIWLMFRLMRKEAGRNGGDRSKTFRFGVMLALLSAVVVAGFNLFYVTVIAPDTFKQAFDTMAQAYSGMLPSDQLDAMMNMESSMPTISFFANLVW